MRINPINTNFKNTSFRAKIVPTESLKQGFDLAERCVSSATMKDLNFVKDFLDSIAKIFDTKKFKKFKIDIDKKHPGYIYTKINGNPISGKPIEFQSIYHDDYLVVEETNKYAKKIGSSEPSILDNLKSELEQTQARLFELEDQYARRLKSELEEAKKIIFAA